MGDSNRDAGALPLSEVLEPAVDVGSVYRERAALVAFLASLYPASICNDSTDDRNFHQEFESQDEAEANTVAAAHRKYGARVEVGTLEMLGPAPVTLQVVPEPEEPEVPEPDEPPTPPPALEEPEPPVDDEERELETPGDDDVEEEAPAPPPAPPDATEEFCANPDCGKPFLVYRGPGRKPIYCQLCRGGKGRAPVSPPALRPKSTLPPGWKNPLVVDPADVAARTKAAASTEKAKPAPKAPAKAPAKKPAPVAKKKEQVVKRVSAAKPKAVVRATPTRRVSAGDGMTLTFQLSNEQTRVAIETQLRQRIPGIVVNSLEAQDDTFSVDCTLPYDA